MDVLFILDSSSDATSTYNTSKNFVRSLSGYLDVNPQEIRTALLVFNDQPVMISDFERYSSASDFASIVDGTPHLGGDRSLSEALRTAAVMFPMSSSSISKVIVLVTSGNPLSSEDDSSVDDVMDKLGDLGVRLYVALIDPDSNIEGFRRLTESPKNVFVMDTLGDISMQINQIGSQLIRDSGTHIIIMLKMRLKIRSFNFI